MSGLLTLPLPNPSPDRPDDQNPERPEIVGISHGGHLLRAKAEAKRLQLLDKYQRIQRRKPVEQEDVPHLIEAGLEVRRARMAMGVCGKRHMARALQIAGRAGRA